MSARFVANFVSLIVGAGLALVVFAFPFGTAHWIALGVGAVAAVMGSYSFASANQGVFQRIADVIFCGLGAWAIVAAVVMNDHSIWLMFVAGGGLAVVGSAGLVVREIELGHGLQVGDTQITPDYFAYMTSLQREAESQR